MRTFTVIQLEPSRWVKEDLLIDLTGMSTNEI
ncbi:excisionase family protein, partial [Vibrio parahaemolyticus]|nr:excisionase family protein [Vibrio parahaemolyticus]